MCERVYVLARVRQCCSPKFLVCGDKTYNGNKNKNKTPRTPKKKKKLEEYGTLKKKKKRKKEKEGREQLVSQA